MSFSRSNRARFIRGVPGGEPADGAASEAVRLAEEAQAAEVRRENFARATEKLRATIKRDTEANRPGTK